MTLALNSSDSLPFSVGDVVRVRDPSLYDTRFAQRVREREATVLWCGKRLGSNVFSVSLRFHKRAGRGKEFQEFLRADDVVKVRAKAPGCPSGAGA